MSVLIRGMEIPQKCGQCKLFHAEHPMHCMAVEGYRTVGAPYGMPRPDWCPLVEIPPHGRLIDIDDAIESYGERAELGYVSQSKFLNVVIQAEGSEE